MQAPDFPIPPSVAVVGLGQMGAGIARNLDRAGFLSVAHDAKPAQFETVGFSENVTDTTVAGLRTIADVILFAVPTTGAVCTALKGTEGPEGQVIIDLTTSDPAESRALAHQLAREDVHYLDAAMSGGAAGADAGELTLMIGGEAGVLAACRPIFETIATSWFHLGAAGAGHAMKLVHNMILHSIFLATCEGLQMASRAGLDPTQAVAVLNAGNARSFVSEVRFPRDILSGTMQARSPVANLEKDLGLAVDFSARLEARTPYGTLTRAILGAAVSAGQKDADFAYLYPKFETLIDRLEAKI